MTSSAPQGGALLRAGIGLIGLGGLAMLGGLALAALLGDPGDTPTRTAEDVESIAPEPAGPVGVGAEGSATEAPVYARDYMMVAAHPVAAHVGAAVLDDGGSAMDAVIAAQMVLNLVEPQSSGIGGGGFLLVWDAPSETLHSYDGRETAPAAGDGGYVRTPDGGFRNFFEALTGGASVGVPGLLRMLEMAHRDHGKADWASLFQPAITLAEDGFPVSPRLHALLTDAPFLRDMPVAREYFYGPEGAPHPVGHVLRNPELAESFRRIAAEGADAFYTGPLARRIVQAVRGADRNPGRLSTADLAGYQAKRRDNLCLDYRVYRVCGMGPPSSGGSTVLQILGLLEAAPKRIADTAPFSPEGIQLFTEAQRLAFADRNRFLADRDFVDVPLAAMLAPDYLRRRAALMDLGVGEKTPQPPGNPTDDRAFVPGALDDSLELPSTTHLVAVDRDGSVASMTSSIETGFGSRVMVGGFLLNNQLTDFSWRAEAEDGTPIANRYQPRKRPRSSMAPTLVFGPDDAPRLAIGSPGGSRIIGYVARSLVAVLDWEYSVQEAVSLPHTVNRNGALDLEDGPALDAAAEAMAARGYTVERRAMTSGLHGVEFTGGLLLGGADPRREGAAVGEGTLNRDLSEVFRDLIPVE